jgi:hypothetical protein
MLAESALLLLLLLVMVMMVVIRLVVVVHCRSTRTGSHPGTGRRAHAGSVALMATAIPADAPDAPDAPDAASAACLVDVGVKFVHEVVAVGAGGIWRRAREIACAKTGISAGGVGTLLLDAAVMMMMGLRMGERCAARMAVVGGSSTRAGAETRASAALVV